jgi:hypothetical protein
MNDKNRQHDKTVYFEGYERHRDAELITPPHEIKKKVGSGGIDPKLIKKAEQHIKQDKTNFTPIAETYLLMLEDSCAKLQDQGLDDDDAFEALLFPLVQLKSQGGMFKYPLITEISSRAINFLEVIKALDDDAYDIISAHKMALKAVINKDIKGNDSTEGAALTQALQDACIRYFKAHS